MLYIHILLFQPTLPARGATVVVRNLLHGVNISTHAPRTGSDEGHLNRVGLRLLISTHAPRTGSDGSRRRPCGLSTPFQPTLPARGATINSQILLTLTTFQPTLPARGATDTAADHQRCKAAFQPTLPARGATRRHKNAQPARNISTHAPRTGSDVGNSHHINLMHISTHAPRTGSDLPVPRNVILFCGFQPTLPARGATLWFWAAL